MDRLSQVAANLSADLDRLEADQKDLRTLTTDELRRLDAEARSIAVGGIRSAAFGLFLVALGFGCQWLDGVL
jgi:hypothetical protein